MQLINSLMLAALVASSAAWQATAPVPAQATADTDMTLTGCVVKGDGGYVLTDVVASTDRSEATDRTATAAAATSAALTTRTLYWLDDDDELEDFAGHRVEVKGEVEGDIDRGEIEIEREDGMIELEIKAKGDKVTIKLPDTPAAHVAVGTSGTVTDTPRDLEFIVRKFDVKDVKSLASSCR